MMIFFFNRPSFFSPHSYVYIRMYIHPLFSSRERYIMAKYIYCESEIGGLWVCSGWAVGEGGLAEKSWIHTYAARLILGVRTCGSTPTAIKKKPKLSFAT